MTTNDNKKRAQEEADLRRNLALDAEPWKESALTMAVQWLAAEVRALRVEGQGETDG